MCYEAAQLAYRIYKDAVRLKATDDEIDALRKKWEELEKSHVHLHHASGFQHPKLIAFYRDYGNLSLDSFYWGLIPHWVKNEEQAQEIWNKTLNARGESILEKPSFKDAAKNTRCIIPLDGFFEHYHKAGKSFPYYIHRKDQEKLFIGGIRSSWLNKETGELVKTVSIVTTKANELLRIIHNNPKLNEARMPLILNDEDACEWLSCEEDKIIELIQPNTSENLDAHTVQRLRGNSYIGNREEVKQELVYSELIDPPTLF